MFKPLRNKYLWLFLLLVGGCLVAMIFSSSQGPGSNGVTPLLQGVYSPLQKFSAGMKSQWNGFTGVFSSQNALNYRISELEKQVGALKIENQSLAEYRNEALRLQKLLDFKDTNLQTYTLLGVRVIARSPDNWYQNLIVDKGSNSGIKPGMPVISPDGLVGRVASVTATSAQVDLITDREMALGAFMEQYRELTGIIEGLGNNTFLHMINIPDSGKLAKGDLVITTGLSSDYPKGIPIGTLIDIRRDPSGLLFTANVKPAVDFGHLEEVMIVLDYRPVPDSKQEAAG